MACFEDFSYQKIGLSCRLMNSVCQMDGVEASEQRYYIVKGGGLPHGLMWGRLHTGGGLAGINCQIKSGQSKATDQSFNKGKSNACYLNG